MPYEFFIKNRKVVIHPFEYFTTFVEEILQRVCKTYAGRT